MGPRKSDIVRGSDATVNTISHEAGRIGSRNDRTRQASVRADIAESKRIGGSHTDLARSTAPGRLFPYLPGATMVSSLGIDTASILSNLAVRVQRCLTTKNTVAF